MYVIKSRPDALGLHLIGLEPNPNILSDKLCFDSRPTYTLLDHALHELSELVRREIQLPHPIESWGRTALFVFTEFQTPLAIKKVTAWQPSKTGPRLDPSFFTVMKVVIETSGKTSHIRLRELTPTEGRHLRIQPHQECLPSSLRPAYPEPHPSMLEYAGRMMHRRS